MLWCPAPKLLLVARGTASHSGGKLAAPRLAELKLEIHLVFYSPTLPGTCKPENLDPQIRGKSILGRAARQGQLVERCLRVCASLYEVVEDWCTQVCTSPNLYFVITHILVNQLKPA